MSADQLGISTAGRPAGWPRLGIFDHLLGLPELVFSACRGRQEGTAVNLSIRQKLNGITLLAMSLGFGLVYFVLANSVRQAASALTIQDITTQARVTGSNCQAALAFADPKSAAETLAGLKASPKMMLAAIYGKGGQLFASYRRPGFAEPVPARLPAVGALDRPGARLGVTQVIELDRHPLGTLYVLADLAQIDQLLASFARIMAVAMAVALLGAILLSAGLHQTIVTRVRTLMETAQSVAHEEAYAVRVPGEGDDEFGKLTRVFNEMLAQIEKRTQQLNTKTSELRQFNQDLEARVADRTAALESANKELEAFSYSVAHDLRAPLRHIDGFADLLTRSAGNNLDEKCRRYVNTIATSAKEMGKLIDALLVFSRLGKAELKKSPVSLSDVVNEARQVTMDGAPDRPIEWQVDPLPEVEADPMMLRQVVLNLLSNAVKYTRKVEHPQVKVSCTGENDHWVVTVQDNGAGFDMRYADKLFGVFRRLHTSQEFEGTGVGLANVRRIIMRHGGRIWAEAAVNEGARFFFTLPRRVGGTTA
jgi:signal transduction histidine kinase